MTRSKRRSSWPRSSTSASWASTLDICRATLENLVQFFDAQGWRTDLDDHPARHPGARPRLGRDFQNRTSSLGRAYSPASVHQYVRSAHTTTKATVGYIHLAERLPTPDDQPSGLDFLNITLPKAKRPTSKQPSGSAR